MRDGEDGQLGQGRPPASKPSAPRRVLVLQGGGALGSYQGGVYEALAAERLEPEWVTGISIGAINAALIAGNPPERRVERLRAFWELISSSSGVTPAAPKQGWARGVQRRERQLDRCFRSARVLQAAPRDDPPRKLLDRLPPELVEGEDFALLQDVARENAVKIVQLIYRTRPYEGRTKDYEFPRPTMLEHWASGLADAQNAVRQDRDQIDTPAEGVATFDPGRATSEKEREVHL
jgi:predicted acylesterase/phospholipase RssA